MRVLLPCKYLPPEAEGGGALTILALARALAREGVEVTLLKARPKHATASPVFDSTEFETHVVDYRDRFDYSERGVPDFYAHLLAKTFNHRQYRRALARLASAPGRFDLIHAQNHTTALAAASLKGRIDLPLAATLRGHGLWCFVLGMRLPGGGACSGCVTANQIPCLGAASLAAKPTVLPALGAMKGWMRYQDRLARRVDLLLPISSMMAAEAARYDRPARVIPDLVEDVDRWQADSLPEPIAAAVADRVPGTKAALYAGRLAPNKGLDLLVDAAAASPDWTVFVAGDDAGGTYRASLERRARERGATNVRFLGWVPNASIGALYDAVDLVVLPFLRPEPLSRGMVEALARGRALAATNHGGPLDGVVDGENGALFAPRAESLAEALGRLASCDLGALGRASRRVYETRFAADRVVAAHLEAYQWLLNR